MGVQRRPLTDRELKAWLAYGGTNRSTGEGLTFVASAGAAIKGKASWILRFRLHGRLREKVLGRYPELSLKGPATYPNAVLSGSTDERLGST